MDGSEKEVMGAWNRHFEIVEKPSDGISNARGIGSYSPNMVATIMMYCRAYVMTLGTMWSS